MGRLVFGVAFFLACSPIWGRCRCHTSPIETNHSRHVVASCKGGVYLPLRRHGFSMQTASFLTFCVSGLLHDFYTSLIFYKHKRHSMPEEIGFSYIPTHSKMVAFFLYNWVIIMLERPVARMLPQWIKTKIPLPIRSTLVLLVSLPVTHW